MSERQGRAWVPSALRVLALFAAVLLGCAALVALAAVLGPKPARRTLPRFVMPDRSPAAPTSDVRWDPDAERESEALPAIPVAPGEEFIVASELYDEAVAEAVLDASNRAIPLTLDLLGGDPRPQRRPYDVLIVRTRDRLREEARRFGDTLRPTTVGFADLVRSRICLTSDDLGDPVDVLALAGPGSELTMTAAHEAAHQVAGRCLPGGGDVGWLCEGIAQYVGELVLLETHPDTEPGAIPTLSSMMAGCRDLLDADQLPISSDVLEQNLGRFDFGTRYALWWAFFRFLNEPPQRERTQRMLAEIRRLTWSPHWARDVTRVVDEVWGQDSRQVLTAGFRRSVAAFEPQWESAGAIRLEASGTAWTQYSTGDRGGCAIRRGRAGEPPYRISGSVEILPRGDGIAEVHLARTRSGWVQIAFEADRGIALWADDKGKEHRLEALVRDRRYLPTVGRRFDFTIDVARDRVRVLVGGAEALTWDPKGRALSGPWGVWCCNYWDSRRPDRSAAIWRDLRLE